MNPSPARGLRFESTTGAVDGNVPSAIIWQRSAAPAR